MSPQKRGIPIGSVVVAPLTFFQPNLSITRAQLILQKGSRAFAAGLDSSLESKGCSYAFEMPSVLGRWPPFLSVTLAFRAGNLDCGGPLTSRMSSEAVRVASRWAHACGYNKKGQKRTKIRIK